MIVALQRGAVPAGKEKQAVDPFTPSAFGGTAGYGYASGVDFSP